MIAIYNRMNLLKFCKVLNQHHINKLCKITIQTEHREIIFLVKCPPSYLDLFKKLKSRLETHEFSFKDELIFRITCLPIILNLAI